MKFSRRNTATAIAVFLMLTMAVVLVAVPLANAHDPPVEIPTTAYMSIAPNPVGVGQNVFVVVWLDRTVSGAVVDNDLRFHDYKLTITRPDETTETVEWPVVWDTTSSAFTQYTPTQVGTYTFKFEFPGQTYTWDDPISSFGGPPMPNEYTNDTYLPSSRTLTLTVQEEQIPDPISSYPLPTEYWTRPIEGQNTDWWKISSNWLGTGSPPLAGWARYAPDGVAPNSAHVMWTKPIQDGGVVGGTNTGIDGNSFYTGMSYNQRFSNPIIMHGRLYYELPKANSGGAGGYMCVDLRTGEEIWGPNDYGSTVMHYGSFTFTSTIVPSFGYYYTFDDGNQHGILPSGLLFTSNFAQAIDPLTGVMLDSNITNVPSGTAALGPKGEHLRYTISNIGDSANPNWRLTQWNSSKMNRLTEGQIGVANWYPGDYDASTAHNYDWNVSIPELPGLSSPSIIQAIPGDVILGRSSTFLSTSVATDYGTPDPYTFWALNLNTSKGAIGSLLWIKNYSAPAGGLSIIQGPVLPVDPINRVFVVYIKETMQWMGFSLDNGRQLWGPISPSRTDYDYYEGWLVSNIAYGKLYYCNYGGILYCVDMKDGKLLWTYGDGGPGNSTSSGLQNTWGRYPIWIGAIADGKVYMLTSEHSPNTPLYKGAKVLCVDAENGTEIFTLLGFGGVAGSVQMAVADGFLVYLNCYDMQIYCVGKGPSDTTVSIQNDVITNGDSVLVKGSVVDISDGTKQDEQAARFPNGVPAVSDESMGEWMEYVYMQKPKPTDVTGVDVTVSVLDPNNNVYDVGTATSDASGTFCCEFTPEVPGLYTVVATFEGSDSYWPSYSETYLKVNEAPAATPEPTPTPAPLTDAYVTGFGIAMIVAIVAIGLVIILMLRKR